DGGRALRPPQEPSPGPERGVLRAQGVRARRRAAPSRLEGLRQVRPLLREAVRARDQPQGHARRRLEWVDGVPERAALQAEVATTLAGTLAYMLVRQQDAVGVSVVTREGSADLPPRAAAGHLHTVLDALDGLQASGGTDLFAAADHLAERVRRGQLIAVFSDL